MPVVAAPAATVLVARSGGSELAGVTGRRGRSCCVYFDQRYMAQPGPRIDASSSPVPPLSTPRSGVLALPGGLSRRRLLAGAALTLGPLLAACGGGSENVDELPKIGESAGK